MNTNEKTFDQQVEDFTVGLANVVAALSPLALILVILGIAMANAYVEYLYQAAVFGSSAVFPAVLLAGFRFASGMGGITLLKRKKYLPGSFFVAVSLLLTLYTVWHIDLIAATVAPAAADQAALTVTVILWGGFVGELMIAGYMGALGNGLTGLPALKFKRTVVAPDPATN